VRRQLRIDLGSGAELRTFTVEDAETIFAVVDRNRERLAQWFPWVDASTGPRAQREWLRGLVADERTMDGNGIWVHGELAGAAGLFFPAEWIGEVGYWLDAAYEGRGLATRAARELVELGFADPAIHRIQLHAAVDNVRSRAVAERLGFEQERDEPGDHTADGPGNGDVAGRDPSPSRTGGRRRPRGAGA
jgi:ribosomal-protein-serine acetyltransferase